MSNYLDALFVACSFGVVPFWILLAVAPTWQWTQRLVHSVLAPVLLGLVYVVLLISILTGPSEGSFSSLDAVETAFTNREVVLLGWVHFLVFDLFVGAWEARDAARRGIHRAAVAPCLFLTFMFGPSGLLTYVVLRGALRRETSLDEVSSRNGHAAFDEVT